MRVLWRLREFLRPYFGRWLVGVVLLAIAGATMSLVIATGKPLVNEVFGAAKPAAAAPAQAESKDISARARAFLERIVPSERFVAKVRERPYVLVPALMVLLFLVRGFCLYFGQFFAHGAGASAIRDIRARLHASLAFQSPRFFQVHSTGVLLARVLTDVQRLQKITTDVLADFVRVGAMIPATLVLILVHDWRMTVVALVALPLMGYPLLKLGKRLRRASSRSQENMGEVASVLTETVTGSRVVQAFSMERFEIARFRAGLDRMLRADLKAIRTAALAPAVLEFLGGSAGALLFFLAGKGIARNRIDPGDFMVVLTGLVLLFMSLRRMAQLNVEMQQAAAAAERVFEVLDHTPDVTDLPGAAALRPFRSEIRFEGVEFAYERDAAVLRGIDVAIRKGEVVAIVGASGAGKTTFANLVPRFYDPTAGRVTIDGHDIRRVTLESLRAQIGLVAQETVLFDDSARNNIAYGRGDVALERVQQVARAAQAHEFVAALPEGYESVVGERGSRLSVGQRQRLAIARALLKDPPILILDEATSALDAESESLVQQALETLMKGRTSIVIAHRLSTIRRADRILVFEKGRIVEEGTHRALLERGGVYARLHELQFQESSS